MTLAHYVIKRNGLTWLVHERAPTLDRAVIRALELDPSRKSPPQRDYLGYRTKSETLQPGDTVQPLFGFITKPFSRRPRR